MSCRQASRHFNIAKSTLQDYVKGRSVINSTKKLKLDAPDAQVITNILISCKVLADKGMVT